jgi:hypothetical protein
MNTPDRDAVAAHAEHGGALYLRNSRCGRLLDLQAALHLKNCSCNQLFFILGMWCTGPKIIVLSLSLLECQMNVMEKVNTRKSGRKKPEKRSKQTNEETTLGQIKSITSTLFFLG